MRNMPLIFFAALALFHVTPLRTAEPSVKSATWEARWRFDTHG